MTRRTQLVIAMSVLLSGIPLVAESTQIIPDLTSGGQTITISPSLTVNPLLPLTNDSTITITTTPPLTDTGNTSTTPGVVTINDTPILIDGGSISPSTAPTTTSIVAVTTAGVPEPSSLLLLGVGLAGFIGLARMRR